MAQPTLIMGVLNVTPDSFSDGGQYLDASAAVRQGMRMVEQGADIIDIGGESTRPGAERIEPEEEQMRILPVVTALVRSGVAVSVDTMNASTAILAAEKGASYINDVSGGLADFFMARAVAATGAYFIASHWRGHSTGMDAMAMYKDAPSDITRELSQRVENLLADGIAPEKLILDPGLGFAKNVPHNWQMLGRLDQLQALGYPLLIGASRKRFLSTLLPENATLDDRDNASVAVSLLAANAGVWGVRVHDVERTATALRALGARPNSTETNPNDTVQVSAQSVARRARLDEELAELTYDFDAEMALAREVAAEERARETIEAQLRAERSAASMMREVEHLREVSQADGVSQAGDPA